jgi:ArsR family transcriptional regulator
MRWATGDSLRNKRVTECSRPHAVSVLDPCPQITWVFTHIITMAAVVASPAVSDLETLFSGFADPTRLRVLNPLAAGELCVCDLVDLLDLPQPLVSRHLAYLRRSGLVQVTRESKYAHYRLAEPAHAVHRNLINCVRSCFAGIKSLDRERRAAAGRIALRDATPCD